MASKHDPVYRVLLLLTGVRLGEEDRLVDDLMEWERKLEHANLDNHMQFLRNAQFDCD